VADLLKRAAERLAALRRTSHSQLVEVRRTTDGGVCVGRDIPARIGRSDDLRLSDTGVVVGVETRDFIIAAVDYDLGDGPVEPLSGDVLTDCSSGEEITYVVAPITGEDGAAWSDRYGVSWRIHTRRTSA
jgi:hypothetical protein